MANEDILIPLTDAEKPVYKKPRWHFFILRNNLNELPTISAKGQWVMVNAAGESLPGTEEGDPSLDMEMTFDPSNPLHIACFGAFDAAIKENYAKLSTPQ